MPGRQAGLADLVFYDRRDTVGRNMRRAGVGYFRIMAIAGHKTMSACRRYHTLDHQDLQQAIGHLDTYTHTSAAADGSSSPKPLKTNRAPVAQADRARDS